MNHEFCKYAQKVVRSKEEGELKALEKSVRSYRCEDCRFWHLTSQPLITNERYTYPEREFEIDY